MKNLEQLVRENIWKMKPYSSARDEFKGEASAFLDANESPFNSPYNRYPDPLQWKLKERIADLKETRPEQIFLGNGSDEAIDLLIRIFCEPKVDNVVSLEPTYGMYKVCAQMNEAEYRKVLLNKDFSLDADRVLESVDEQTKLVFICSPNNPTANILNQQEIEKILTGCSCIVVVDEAYIDFAVEHSFLPRLSEFDNLVVLQTFSKAWGLAGVRLGMAFASPQIIYFLNKIKYPYNINVLTQNFVYEVLQQAEKKHTWVEGILNQREKLLSDIQKFTFVSKVFPSEANFVLVQVTDANKIYELLAERGVIVRNRSSVTYCEECLRITVGSADENKKLLQALTEIEKLI